MNVLYTTVPFAWRKWFGVVRASLASAGLLSAVFTLSGFEEAGVALAFAAWFAWSIYLLFRDPADSGAWPILHLITDFGFVLLAAALLPGAWALIVGSAAWLYVLVLGALMYTWRHVLLLVTGAVLALAVADRDFVRTAAPTVLTAGGVAVILAAHKHQLQERLSNALKRSVLSRSEAEQARETERHRIAADFHDGPLQSFISFQMRLEIIRKLMSRNQEAAMSELMQLQDLGRAQVTELRTFVRGMQPLEVTPQNLGSAIREAAEHFERDSGVSAQLYCGDLSKVDTAIALELLQIVREALNNVRKHSKASRVSVVIEATDGAVEVSVEDDGSGFPFSGSYTLDELEIMRLGPKSIQRRVRVLGGDLTLDSRPTEGASLRIRVPAVR